MEQSFTKLWNDFLRDIRQDISDQVFNAWFVPMVPTLFSGDKLTISVPNEFFKEWVRERYLALMDSRLHKLADKKIVIEFVVLPEMEIVPAKENPRQTVSPQQEKRGWLRSVFPKQTGREISEEGHLNAKYRFDNFVVGPSNRFAHAASLAISQSPAKTYNPFFIYGGVGLGKTHLMHAIGNEVIKNSAKAKTLYISSEEFTNQLITAIQKRTTQEFRKRYRTLDVLLIDDIHFIAGKEATQEEFFHTFNSLYDAHKQIILSSDQQPKEIPALEERLVSRFAWGLITDIQPPDFETRVAILKKKSEAETTYLPDEFFFFLAEKIKTNIRELEGALIRVVAYAKLMNKDVTIDLAKEVLKGMIIEEEKKISIPLIQTRVAEYFEIDPKNMKAKKRTKVVVYPRQIAMYLSRILTDLSLPEIGQSFGGRDHTTVLHACEKIEKSLKSNKKVCVVVDKLLLLIKK